MTTQVILLEQINKLGTMGDIVDVKPGYARNYLLPQAKALRATKENIAYFETQKESLQKANDAKKKTADDLAKSMDGLKIILIRQAGESGQLYGSVTARDIADSINEIQKNKIDRGMVELNQNVKTIGLFDVKVLLHPEVSITINVNIARTEDEAKLQEKTGQAVVNDNRNLSSPAPEVDTETSEKMKSDLMDEQALEAEKESERIAAEKAEKEAQAKAEKEAAATAKAENTANSEEILSDSADENSEDMEKAKE